MNTLTQARIRIVGPDEEGGFLVEFCKHTGPKLVFVIPPNADNDVLAYFQERMPYGIAVPDIGEMAVQRPHAEGSARGRRSG
ncbi:MAG: hypothetical protein QOE78_4738 [Alphaproteobacteria bacterium]|jgi:hypothetical protein|nr:hypothetical protein [Alphaproteobacteria bacterium]